MAAENLVEYALRLWVSDLAEAMTGIPTERLASQGGTAQTNHTERMQEVNWALAHARQVVRGRAEVADPLLLALADTFRLPPRLLVHHILRQSSEKAKGMVLKTRKRRTYASTRRA